METTHATQLRVGNLFRFISTDSIEQVADIRTAGIKTPTINNVLITDIEPIPLNEDWLVKFGFEKPAHSWNGKIFHLSEWDAFPLNWCVAMDKNNAVIVRKLQYVHQLQNLYFALTGTELTLTDK